MKPCRYLSQRHSRRGVHLSSSKRSSGPAPRRDIDRRLLLVLFIDQTCLHLNHKSILLHPQLPRWATAVAAAMSFQASWLDVDAAGPPEVNRSQQQQAGGADVRSGRTAAKSSSVLSDGRPVTPEGARGDAWSRRYVQRSPGSASKKSSANTVLRHDTNEPAFSEPASTSARPPPPTRKHSKHLKLPHMSPSLEDVEETITRAFGSVLDPQSQRAKWACAACNTMFVRVSLPVMLE